MRQLIPLEQKMYLPNQLEMILKRLDEQRACFENLRQVLGMFSFKKRLFAWSTFQAHMTDGVRKLLKLMKTDDALIPGGCSKYVKALGLE